MNRGHIPGFYYDEEKKKYFKIQANHKAPAGAKHSISNVNREKRAAKKRKAEGRQQEVRQKQTVRESRILEDSLVGSLGLRRESGLRSHISNLADGDAVFLSNLRQTRINVKPPNAACGSGTLVEFKSPEDVFRRPEPGDEPAERDVSMLAYNHVGSCSIWITDNEGSSPMTAFNSGLVSVDALKPNTAWEPLYIVCAREAKYPGNVSIGGFLPGNRLHNNYLQLGNADSSLWSSALHPGLDMLAVSSTEAIYILDVQPGMVAHQLPSCESRAITWLSTNTVAFGTESSGSHSVRLWDIRSGGTRERFRRSKPITGVSSLGNDLQVLVSDNKHLDLYDTRWAEDPILRLHHTHEGPQLQFSERGGIVAAVGMDNEVLTYSLRTCRALGRLRNASGHNERLLTKLRWTTQGGNDFLQACQGTGIVRWMWEPED